MKKQLAALALVATATLGLGACGGGDDNVAPSPGASSSTSSSASPTPEVVAEVPNLTGKMTQVTLDAGFMQALTTLQLAPAPVGSATIDNGVASFPITGGNVTYYKPGSVDPYVQGVIKHDGSGLSLTGGGTTVELTDFSIDPGKPAILSGKVTANGQVAAESAPLFDLDGSTLKPLQTNPDGTAVLEGTQVKLSDAAADLLNQTYKTDALKGGTLIGIAKITINTM